MPCGLNVYCMKGMPAQVGQQKLAITLGLTVNLSVYVHLSCILLLFFVVSFVLV